MKALQKTLFIVAMLTLSTQTLRHAYVRWLEPRGSVLDRYAPAVREDIKNAESLDVLVKKYDEARKQVKEADEKPGDPTIISARKSETEPYKSESLLEEAIRDWERQSKEIFDLRFFWFSGLAFLGLGYFGYRKHYLWLGLTFMIAGFSEMIWATSPYLWGGSEREFNRLLTNKFTFSLLSLLLLVVVGYLAKVVVEQNKANQ